MITKERLEELKKEGAIVWQIKNNGEFNMALPIKLDYVTIKYLEEGIEVKSDVYMLFKISEAYDRIYFMRYDELTEDEEEANFINRYQGITRTETLSLPTWEEFVKLEENSDYGFTDIKRFDNVRFGYKYCPEKQISALFVDKNGKTLFYTLMVTKENYLEACKLCKKLFLGGEEE